MPLSGKEKNAFFSHETRQSPEFSLTRPFILFYQFVVGDVAQLGERSVRNAEVVGSIPIISTTKKNLPLRYGLAGAFSVFCALPYRAAERHGEAEVSVNTERYGVRLAKFVLGLNLIALGVSLSTMVLLGTSPISAIPYALSIVFPACSFGVWIIIFNVLLTVIEYFMLYGKIRFSNILVQCALIVPFGFMIDLYMYLCNFLYTDVYLYKILYIFCGCIIISIGLYLEIMANMAMLPVDAFVMAISLLSKINFGRIRLFSDISMSLIAMGNSHFLVGMIAGVVEGTIISASAIGNMVKLIMKMTG